MVKQKDEIVSISKAYGIMLMVLAHAGLCVQGQHIVYMFHMPLFFFYAGYCFKEEYTKDIKRFIKRKILRLYIPFLIWSLLFLAVHNIFYRIGIYSSEYGYNNDVSYLYNCSDYISRFFFITFLMSKFEQIVGGYWFVRELFWASIVCCSMLRFFNIVWLITISISLTLLSSIMNYYGVVPFILQLTLLSISFFLIGYFFKKENLFQYKTYLLAVICLVCLLICAYYYPTSMLTFSVNNVIPYIISAISGIYLIHCISSETPSLFKKYLVYIGDNSFIILTLHMLSFKVISLIYVFHYKLEIVRISEFPTISDIKSSFWVIAYFVVGIILPLGYVKIKNKWLYILK